MSTLETTNNQKQATAQDTEQAQETNVLEGASAAAIPMVDLVEDSFAQVIQENWRSAEHSLQEQGVAETDKILKFCVMRSVTKDLHEDAAAAGQLYGRLMQEFPSTGSDFSMQVMGVLGVLEENGLIDEPLLNEMVKVVEEGGGMASVNVDRADLTFRSLVDEQLGAVYDRYGDEPTMAALGAVVGEVRGFESGLDLLQKLDTLSKTPGVDGAVADALGIAMPHFTELSTSAGGDVRIREFLESFLPLG